MQEEDLPKVHAAVDNLQNNICQTNKIKKSSKPVNIQDSLKFHQIKCDRNVGREENDITSKSLESFYNTCEFFPKEEKMYKSFDPDDFPKFHSPLKVESRKNSRILDSSEDLSTDSLVTPLNSPVINDRDVMVATEKIVYNRSDSQKYLTHSEEIDTSEFVFPETEDVQFVNNDSSNILNNDSSNLMASKSSIEIDELYRTNDELIKKFALSSIRKANTGDLIDFSTDSDLSPNQVNKDCINERDLSLKEDSYSIRNLFSSYLRRPSLPEEPAIEDNFELEQKSRSKSHNFSLSDFLSVLISRRPSNENSEEKIEEEREKDKAQKKLNTRLIVDNGSSNIYPQRERSHSSGEILINSSLKRKLENQDKDDSFFMKLKSQLRRKSLRSRNNSEDAIQEIEPENDESFITLEMPGESADEISNEKLNTNDTYFMDDQPPTSIMFDVIGESSDTEAKNIPDIVIDLAASSDSSSRKSSRDSSNIIDEAQNLDIPYFRSRSKSEPTVEFKKKKQHFTKLITNSKAINYLYKQRHSVSLDSSDECNLEGKSKSTMVKNSMLFAEIPVTIHDDYLRQRNHQDPDTSKYFWDFSWGKSRSVDHTFHRKLDFDAFRRKIGERTTSEPSRDLPPSLDPSSEVNRDITTPEKRAAPKTTLSAPSITYTVQANDTLMRIAARFDTTPSELTKLNRLSTRFLFPGQLLIVPDKGGSKENEAHIDTEQPNNKESRSSPILSDLQPPASPQAGNYPRTPANSVETDRSLDKECLEKFLKIQVRHITDGQGVVAGVLLVTPNAVMFDPNVSDPLVIERGSESYGVIAPMEFVVNAALYYDIAHMKVKDTILPRPDIPKPEIYFGPKVQNNPKDDPKLEELLNTEKVSGMGCSEESPSKEGPLPAELNTQDNDDDSTCSCGGDTRETSAFPKAFEHELLTPISTDISPTTTTTTENTQPQPADLGTIAETVSPSSPNLPTFPPQVAQKPCDKPESTQDIAQKIPLHSCMSAPLTNEKKRTTSVTFSSSSESDMPPLLEDSAEIPCHESRKQKVLKRISYPLSWMENLGSEKDAPMGQTHPTSAPPSGVHSMGGQMGDDGKGMFSNVFSMSNVSNMLTRRHSQDVIKRPGTQAVSTDPLLNPLGLEDPQSQKRAQFKEGPKFGLKSMVSLEDMPELFASFDKLIPKPASASEESPLYLCLRMGKPIDKPIPRNTPIMTYGKKTMRPEYWFSIPKTRTDDLYNFFQIWSNEIYGELDDEVIKSRGFLIIEEEIEMWPPNTGSQEGVEGTLGTADELREMTKEMTKESWEVAAMSEELRRALYSSNSLTSLDIEMFLPEVLGVTELIDDAFRKNMYKKMPARVQGHNWKLVFSTSTHGYNLKSLYRKMNEIDTPIILLIQDTQQNKFGALLSCPLKMSELFYGTGEAFMFVCQPEFQVFPWTGENTFFAKGNNESLYIGGGDGNFGIWLDGDLYQGRSQPCKTYGNPVLSGNDEDFIIKTIECWYFD